MLKKLRFLIAFIALSICLCLMSNTYSRYIADTTGSIDVALAKWQILVNETDITNNTSSSISFTPVIEENANVASDTFAPSSTGYFDVNIDPSNVDLSFTYTITLSLDNTNFPDIKMTDYAILPSGYIEGDPLVPVTIENNEISNNMLYDNETPDFAFEAFTIRVYFEWYEGEGELMDDDADTLVGENAANDINSIFTINSNIAFEQIIS